MQLPHLLAAGLCASLALSAQQNPAPADPGDDMPALAFDATLNLDLPGARSLLALRGTAVLVEYWATWCGPCKAQVPHMNEVQDQFKAKGLVVLAVTGEDETLVAKFVQQNKVTYPVVIEKGQASQKQLGVKGIPHALLLDPAGKIVWRCHPGSLTAEDIGRALAGAHVPGAPLTGPLEPVGRLLLAQDFGKAAATMKAMLDAGRLPDEFRYLAQGALARIEAQAQALFDSADAALERHDYAGAVQALDRLAGPFAGVLATDRAIAKAKELRANPDIARQILGFDPTCAACKELGAACKQHKRE